MTVVPKNDRLLWGVLLKKIKLNKQFLEEYPESICAHVWLFTILAYQAGCLCVENILQTNYLIYKESSDVPCAGEDILQTSNFCGCHKWAPSMPFIL